MLILLIVLLLPTTARLTRLVTRDKIPLLSAPRDKFVERWGVYEDDKGEERKISIGQKPTNIFMASLAYLWECDWCTSMWIGGGLTYLTWRWPGVMLWVLIALTTSYAAGWNSTAESCVNRDRS